VYLSCHTVAEICWCGPLIGAFPSGQRFSTFLTSEHFLKGRKLATPLTCNSTSLVAIGSEHVTFKSISCDDLLMPVLQLQARILYSNICLLSLKYFKNSNKETQVIPQYWW